MVKLIGLFCVLFTVTSASAKVDSDRAQNKAQDLFDRSSSVEAYLSNRFSKRVWNKRIPGTNLSVKPNSLCVYTNTVQTIKPRPRCLEWKVNFKEKRFGKDFKYFTSYSRALRESRKSYARSQIECSDSISEVLWAPISEFESLNFKVDFYRKTVRDRFDSEKFLGTHYFRIRDCQESEVLREALLDGGEFSGGSRKIQTTESL